MSSPSAAALQLIPEIHNLSQETHFPLNVGSLLVFYIRVRQRFSSSGGDAKQSFLLYPITPLALQRSGSRPLPPQTAC